MRKVFDEVFGLNRMSRAIYTSALAGLAAFGSHGHAAEKKVADAVPGRTAQRIEYNMKKEEQMFPYSFLQNSKLERDLFDNYLLYSFFLPEPDAVSSGGERKNDVLPLVAKNRAKAGHTSRNFFPRNTIPEPYRSLFVEAGTKYQVPPELIAAVFKAGEHNGQSWQDLVKNYGGRWAKNPESSASGPFQFIKSTWRAYGVDADGDGTKNVNDVEDAAHSAARYLGANINSSRRGSEEGRIRHAIGRYNHSREYVNHVYAYYQRLRR